MPTNLPLVFVVAMAVTMALVPLLMRLARPMQVLDAPGERKVHIQPMPRIGGIAILAGVLAALALGLPALDTRMLGWLGGAAIVFAFGVWDDRADLPPAVKLLGQLLAVGCVVFIGGVSIETFTLTQRYPLPEWIALPLTFLFLLGATNAVNLADGLDGLAGGTALLSVGALALLAMIYQVVPVAVTAAAMAGSLFGFLRFNAYPARIFMGDGGSQLLGYTVGTLAIMLTQSPVVPLSTALPLMLLGLPAIDTLMVMAQRWRESSPIFRGDNRHVHHKLLGLGFDHAEAVIVIYVVQALFFLTAWQIRYEPDPTILAVFSLLALGIIVALGAAGRLGWRWRRVEGAAPPDASRLRQAMLWLAVPTRLPRWAIRTAGVCVLAYMLAVAMLTGHPPMDVGWLAAALTVVLAVAIALAWYAPATDWLARIVLYVGAAMAAYLDHVTVDHVPLLQQVKYVALPLLVICVVARIRLSQERRFQVTALDLLVLFAAAVVPLLPGLSGGESDVGLSLVKLVALIYALELFTDQSPRGQRLVASGIGVFFIVVAVRALAWTA